jgi:hypothetical protein
MAYLCSQNNIDFIIIELPGVNETQNRSAIGPYNLVVNDQDSVVLYNFNSYEFCRFIDPEKDWAGLSHLNKYGAMKFTKRLIARIPLKN